MKYTSSTILMIANSYGYYSNIEKVFWYWRMLSWFFKLSFLYKYQLSVCAEVCPYASGFSIWNINGYCSLGMGLFRHDNGVK